MWRVPLLSVVQRYHEPLTYGTSPDGGTAPMSDSEYFDQLFLARLADYSAEDAVPWARRLWDVGSILSLEELWEAGDWQRQGVLSPGAVDWQRRELQRITGPDLGLGDKDLRRQVQRVLASPVPDPSPNRRQLRQLIDHARNGYLNRWSAAIEAGIQVRPERLARTVASHLLDLGYSPTHMTHWVSSLRRRSCSSLEALEAASGLASGGESQFQVLLALVRAPQMSQLNSGITSWCDQRGVSEWLKANGFSTSGVRAAGGFVLEFKARDPFGAAAQARALADRLQARSTYLRQGRDGLEVLPQAWVVGHPRPISLATPARGADVLSLAKEGLMYRSTEVITPIDDALEIGALVNKGALGPALSGAWAAIESLLVHPDDPRGDDRWGKAVAADRLAAVIACSWPRAELTSLAHHYSPVAEDDPVQSALAQCTTNRQRAWVMVDALKSGLQMQFEGRNPASEQAASQRMQGLLADPRGTLREVRDAVTIALRRLYRSRNIVLHGGSTRGVALRSSLRTAAPLFGAGLDRIVHAHASESISALDLAARAECALGLVGGETGLTVVDLLEDPGTWMPSSEET